MSINNGKPDWRTRESFNTYIATREERSEYKGCVLCEEEIIRDFKYWRIIPNAFPYDRVADVHHLLLLNRHSSGEDITPEEESELAELKKVALGSDYGFIMQTLGSTTSIPTHLHYHLIRPKSFD